MLLLRPRDAGGTGKFLKMWVTPRPFQAEGAGFRGGGDGALPLQAPYLLVFVLENQAEANTLSSVLLKEIFFKKRVNFY